MLVAIAGTAASAAAAAIDSNTAPRASAIDSNATPRASAADSNATPRAFAPTVAVLARPSSRFATELARELAASSFIVVPLALPSEADADPDPRPRLRPLLTTSEARLGVALIEDAQPSRVLILSRDSTPGALSRDRSLSFDRNDSLGRRRVWLAVVEHLRFLLSGAPASDSPAPEGDPPASARATTSAPATSAAGAAFEPAPATTSVAAAAPLRRESTLVPPPGTLRPRAPFALGLETSLELPSQGSTTTSHVRIFAQRPFDSLPRLSLRAAASWPLSGLQVRSHGADIRMWSFGLGMGLQLSFVSRTAALQPFIGTGVGLRLLLSDADWLESRQSRVSLTAAASVAIEAGLRVRLAPLVYIVLAAAGEDAFRAEDEETLAHEQEAATERLAQFSLGVLFEY